MPIFYPRKCKTNVRIWILNKNMMKNIDFHQSKKTGSVTYSTDLELGWKEEFVT